MITHAYVIDVTNKQLAIRSPTKFYQNASALCRQFSITREEACQIVKSCPACPVHFSLPTYLVNPRGFMPDHLRQMDVTLFPTFGPLKYIHVSIDTFSGFVHATAHTGEACRCTKSPLFRLIPNGNSKSHQNRQWLCIQFKSLSKILPNLSD